VRRLLFVTHAEVVIDPEVPVTEWSLSPEGRARHDAFSARVTKIASVWSSGETKARDGADILAASFGLTPRVLTGLHENDRSATGYLPPPKFEATADAFFANPAQSIWGWERAIGAQARCIAALSDVIAASPEGDIAVVAHGGIGALLRAHVLKLPIDRSHDQPPGGGGHVMVLGLPVWTLLQDWQRIELFEERAHDI
jgi:broad specificity phosphatase PhoE